MCPHGHEQACEACKFFDKMIAPSTIAFWVVKTPWERWVGGMTRGKEALKAIEEIGGVICSLTRVPYAGMGFMPNFRPWKSVLLRSIRGVLA